MRRFCKSVFYLIWIVSLSLFGATLAAADPGKSVLSHYLIKVQPDEILPGADAFGPEREDLPVAPILKGGQTVGWAFATSDFVGTTGYSGKPIHIVVGVSPDAVLTGAKLVKHSEPIVLVGIPESKIRNLIHSYAGTDLRLEAAAKGSSHELDIVSGATVTVMIIDDTVLRAGIKVAQALGLGGMQKSSAPTGPQFTLRQDVNGVKTWAELAGSGAVRRITMDVGQINQAFDASGDAKAAARPEPGEAADTYLDVSVALVSVPEIGISLLGEAEYKNLTNWLKPGEQAILVAGRGRYSFKGTGYVRGGIFDRITVTQGDRTVRFHDNMHRRLGDVVAAGSPAFKEVDLFKIPVDAEFDATEPWDFNLLVHRAIGAIKKSFLTFDLGYRLPDSYLVPVQQVAAPISTLTPDEQEAAAKAALWQKIWRGRKVQIAGLLAMLLVLTGVFFFQKQVTRNARAFYWFRMGFLAVTLVFLGWIANAQLSVVNLMALAGSLRDGFTWDAFLLDPMIFILWSSVAVALIFWGRGAYCGWLCPFGALQELTNQVARALHVPQVRLPWGLHERLWPIKYLIFLMLFGISIASIPLAEHYAEVEPFKTAIILKFQRAWPFVLFVVVLLGAGLFIERFYCRYLCPLGAALAIPARMRMFNWLKRYRECGNPCQSCANECPVDAIHPTGEINPNECVDCLHCQVLYQSDSVCPVIIKQLKRRAKDRAANETSKAAMTRALAGSPRKKETGNV
jgi:NosR/NirI family transcriptional regulator, nitrous oxide reductase regulator